jgi:GR25 family glycosyltransferase involved in LPS biosynthesis
MNKLQEGINHNYATRKNRRFPVKDGFERETKVSLLWVNLDRSSARRTHMEKVLTDPIFNNMEKTRISAIDGQDPSNLGKYMKKTMQRTMRDCEYGCTLSHLEAIKQFSQTTSQTLDQSYALILEDDVCLDFKHYWKKTLNEIIEEAPQDWEIIQLTYIILGQEPKDLYEEWTNKKNLCSTAAYIISKTAAIRITNKLYKDGKWELPDNLPNQADRLIYLLCKTYTYKDCPFIYRTENDSLIHPSHLDFHGKNKEKIERMLFRQDIEYAFLENKVLIMCAIVAIIRLLYKRIL